MKKIITIIISLIIIFTLILAFKENKNNSNNEKVIVSEVTHSVFYTPWYVALENGYFNDEGLDIEVILTPGADKVASSVLSGDANVGFSGPEATVYVYNNSKEKLITFASLTKRDGQFIVGPCSLKNNFKLEDLEGKTMLAGRSGGMPLLMFKYALKESNISENKVTIDTSVEFAALSGAFISKQGEFVNLFEPNALKIEKENYGCVLASLGNISGIVPYTTFYAKEEYINNNKKTITKFNKALNKGLEFVKKNDELTIANAIKNQFVDLSIEDLSKIIKRYKDADSWYDTTYINIKDYDRLLDIMIYGKTIEKKVDINLLITNEFN
jgi:NitT/TauT family transport system substrate-binding protein